MTRPMLSGVAYELGETAEQASELAELDDRPDLTGSLLSAEAGFETYYRTDADVTELIAASAGRTLDLTGVDAAEIDVVLLATDSLPKDRTVHRVLAGLLGDLGLAHAAVLGVGLLDCATAMVGVGLAASMVRDGSCRHALVVSADVADLATGGDRIVAGGAAVASDAAATALVSAEVPGFAVLAAARHAAPELDRTELGAQRQLMIRTRAHRALFDRLGSMHAFDRAAVRKVLPSNFARNVTGLYLAGAGFAREQLYLDNVGRVAHCLGSDPLVNLADLVEAGEPAPGHYVLFASGISHLGAVLLDSA